MSHCHLQPTILLRLLDEPTVEQLVQSKDGSPIPDYLPKSVIKPEDLGFDTRTYRIMDFGHSFQHTKRHRL